MVLITIVTGAYKPTYNWGASHCTNQRLAHFFGFAAEATSPAVRDSAAAELARNHLKWNSGTRKGINTRMIRIRGGSINGGSPFMDGL